MKKSLEVTVCLENRELTLEILEPESGDRQELVFPYSPEEHPEFNETVGNEIYSWAELMADEMEDSHE